MKVKVIDPAGWYFNGFNPHGSIVECSESVYEANKSILEKDVQTKGKEVRPVPDKGSKADKEV